MAATAALSGSITDLGLDIPTNYLSRVTMVVEANTPGSLLRDTTGNTLLAGAKRITVDRTSGSFSQTLVTTNATGIVPADDRLYQVTLTYPSGKPGAGNVTVQSGWFTFTAAASLASVWQGIEVTAVSSAVYASISQSVEDAQAAQAAAETARDGAVAIVGPVDATVEGLIKNTGGIGPLTSAALSATLVPRRELFDELGGTPVPLFLFIGESNAGGIAPNSSLTSDELAPRPSVLIWDNDNNDGFDVLDIGTNNLRGHAMLTGVVDPNGGGDTHDHTVHGWENGLAHSAEDGDWNAQVYLLKAGQGGSTLGDWDPTDPYWTTYVTRLNAAITYLRGQGLLPQVYVFASIGINDQNAGLAPATYGYQLPIWLARVRAAITAANGTPNAPIAFTTLPGGRADYNAQVQAVAANDPLLFLIDSAALPTIGDGMHWNAASMKIIALLMVEAMRSRIGQGAQYAPSLASGGLLSLLRRIDSLESRVPADLADVSWVALTTGATAPGGGVLSRSSNTPNRGATSASPGRAAGFSAVLYASDEASSKGTALIVESTYDTAQPDFDGALFVACIYHFGGLIYAGTSGANATSTGVAMPAYPAQLRLRASGTNLTGEVSGDNGATWTAARTFTDALVGITELYPKVTFAVPDIAPQSVRVRASINA